MRKASAILFQFILLFNIAGYRAWYYCAEKKADVHMETSLDNHQYDESDLITLRVPLNMPYQTQDGAFERASGELTVEGRVYKYVKRRVSQGTLVLLCLPDVQKTKINMARTAYGNLANEVSSPLSGKTTGHNDLQKNSSCSEYEAYLFGFNIPAPNPAKYRFTDNLRAGLPEFCLAAPGKPPRNRA